MGTTMKPVHVVKNLNKNHKKWLAVLLSKWPEGEIISRHESIYKLIIVNMFISGQAPTKHVVGLNWTEGVEARLATNSVVPYFYNKFIVGSERKYSVYNRDSLVFGFFLKGCNLVYNDAEIVLEIQTPETMSIYQKSIEKEKRHAVSEFAIKSVTIKRNGDIFINGETLCVQSFAKRTGKRTLLKDKLAAGTSQVSYRGRMTNAIPVWRAGLPTVSGVYVCASFPKEEGKFDRDVLSRFAVKDSHTEVQGRSEGTRVQENLYVFDLEATKKEGTIPWQHVSTGFYDAGITHYLDFEVTYE